jgi:ADP-ribose pyrophosphatase YjhB (NUDIX family)
MNRLFNVRVYGLLIKDNHVLVCKERYGSHLMTKFPGGGLEFGEGTIDCLKRECAEELNITIDNVGHFYTTDFFQASAFNPQQQLISIYYTASVIDEVLFPFVEQVLNDKDELVAYWMPVETLSADHFTFPIDKMVVRMLREKYA